MPPPRCTRVRRYSATQSYLDKWYGSRVLMVLTHITRAWVAPLKWQSGDHMSDHDRVGISLGKWKLGKVELEKWCKGCSKKQIKEYKLIMSKWAKGRVLSDDVVRENKEFNSMMMTAFRQVEVKFPAQGPKGEKQ